MTTIVNDCPRCGVNHVTFDVLASVIVSCEYSWQYSFEAFMKCRHCLRPSIAEITLLVSEISSRVKEPGGLEGLKADITPYFRLNSWIDISITVAKACPSDLPPEIEQSFREGARCLAIKCFNAAGAMFRLCLDHATKERLPADDVQPAPTKHERRNLAPRLRWLFDQGVLPSDLQDLSAAVKENGDDGAHDGSLSGHDAEDIYDFAYQLLDRLYSQPARLAAAKVRRDLRRGDA